MKMKAKPMGRMPGRAASYTIITLITALVVFIAYEILLPAINLQDPLFWIFVIGALLLWGGLSALVEASYGYVGKAGSKISGVPILIAVGIAAVGILIAVASATIFHAKTYANILKVEEKETITEDLPNVQTTSSIALMDTDSATRLGDRKLGSLSKVVSQYNVSNDYSQISLNGDPMKVVSLEYAGLIKYFKNRANGVPGYITVSPANMDAEYVELEKGMRYVPSAYLLEDLYRHVRHRYPTALLEGYSFELDEDGNPYYTFPVYKNEIFLFGGRNVKGVITVDPVSGDTQYYDTGDVPNWVDRVFEGDLLCDQYNWHGLYSDGFLNSVFSQTGCKKITEFGSANGEEKEGQDSSNGVDYGYVVKNNDVWVYTGVTSLNSDQSNVGFVLMNERTGECNYYSLPGADEKSAMNAAEGELQQYGYKASFPSLINIDGVPTYIMVLKDDSGIVKQYAAVNVEQYNIVATAPSQGACINKYNELLGKGPIVDEDLTENSEAGGNGEKQETLTPVTVTIAKMEYVVIDGDTWVYLLGTDQQIYKTKFADGKNEEIMMRSVGDTIQISVDQNHNFDL